MSWLNASDCDKTQKANAVTRSAKAVGSASRRAAIEADHAAARRLFAAGCPDLAGAMVTINLPPGGAVRLVVHRLPAAPNGEPADPVCVELDSDSLRRLVAIVCEAAVAMTAAPNTTATEGST